MNILKEALTYDYKIIKLLELVQFFFTGIMFAKCDYVQTALPASVIYGSDDITIQCLQINLRDQDSIYSFLLSKEINGKTDDIVKIEADTNNPPQFFRVRPLNFVNSKI